jgi:hypothetical protein
MFKSIIASTVIALTATTAMASETIVCSLTDFQASINGNSSYGKPSDYFLSETPLVLDIPAEAINNGWTETDEFGFSVFNHFKEETMRHNMAIVYMNQNGNFVTVNVVKSCIKLG